jgi:hypothetical protein
MDVLGFLPMRGLIQGYHPQNAGSNGGRAREMKSPEMLFLPGQIR